MQDDRSPIHRLIERLKRDGSRIAEPVHVEGLPPIEFSCEFSSDGIEADEPEAIPLRCPPDLKDFWAIARTAKLFEDRLFGQWGLEILDPGRSAELTADCLASRARDFLAGDLVIGRFLGDSDLLVVRTDDSRQDYGEILVALPLDPRGDWDRVAGSFREFLVRYVESGGDKYWAH